VVLPRLDHGQFPGLGGEILSFSARAVHSSTTLKWRLGTRLVVSFLSNELEVEIVVHGSGKFLERVNLGQAVYLSVSSNIQCLYQT
jgi:hypothetical protein